MGGRTTCLTFYEPAWIGKLCLALYKLENRYIRKMIRTLLLRRRGADMNSLVLREIFTKYHHIDIGLYSYGLFSVPLSSGTVVGRYTSVADGLIVLDGSHPIKRISSHPFFFNPDCGFVDKRLNVRRSKLVIGHDVYIGLNVTILPAVTQIGDGAVIAAGSVVVKDVPPYTLIGGNPAKIIRYRFKPKTLEIIKASKWWEKSIEDLKNDNAEFSGFLKDLE